MTPRHLRAARHPGFWRGLPWALLLCLAASFSPAAWAHKPSDSYLRLQLQPAADGQAVMLKGQWDIALRDLDHAIGLDADGDGDITWGEVRLRHADIAAYALARLALQADGQPCTLQAGAQLVDDHSDGAYTVLPFEARCPRAQAHPAAPELGLRYTLFADLDPQHRGLLSLQWGAGEAAATQTAVFGPEAAEQRFSPTQASAWRTFGQYVVEGVWHIWIGFDHILFLLSLLLPAVMVWRASPPRGWTPAARWRDALVEVLKVVTAFTLAHSITLTLAALGWLSLPSRWVESVIAASVVLAALNNVWPLMQGRRWSVAFAFGLIHGFGFASVLSELGLPQQALALALVGFNVGVELGQLAIVVAFLPLAFWLRRTRLYRRGVLQLGSLAIAALAGLWLVERAFDLKLMPW